MVPYSEFHAANEVVEGFSGDLFELLRALMDGTALKPEDIDISAIEGKTWDEVLKDLATNIIAGELYLFPDVINKSDARARSLRLEGKNW